MSEPEQDPIEELCVRWTKERIATSEVLHAAIPAIRALQERVKQLEKENKRQFRERVKESEHTNNYIGLLHKAEAKLARVIETGEHLFFKEEYGHIKAQALEAWRKAVSE